MDSVLQGAFYLYFICIKCYTFLCGCPQLGVTFLYLMQVTVNSSKRRKQRGYHGLDDLGQFVQYLVFFRQRYSIVI